ncbi:hypothetical protein [Mesorhizobium sp. A623]
MDTNNFLQSVWSIYNGKRVHPYKGEKGDKKGLFSINFTNDTNKFEGMTEEQLVKAITSGLFRNRGTIRMRALDSQSGSDRNAFAPDFYLGKRVKDF